MCVRERMSKRNVVTLLGLALVATACASSSSPDEEHANSNSAFSFEGKDYLEQCEPWKWDCKMGLTCIARNSNSYGYCLRVTAHAGEMGGSCVNVGCTEGYCTSVPWEGSICFPD